MFIVYCGYVGPDHYDSSGGRKIYEILTFGNQAEVLKHYADFQAGIGKEDSHVEYRVFSGSELRIEPVQRVTEFKLVADDDDE